LKIYFFLFLIQVNGYALNHFYAFGAGGEPTCNPNSKDPAHQPPNCNKTIFDINIQTLSDSLKNNKNWKIKSSFDGGHSKTKELLSTTFKDNVEFNTENFKEEVKQIVEKVRNKEIKEGESLVIYIDTHGSLKTNDTKSHFVATSSKDGENIVNLDLLDEVVKVTGEAKVKLAIIDLSCYSGNSQAFKSNAPHVCVISAAGPTQTALNNYDGFSYHFLSQLNSGQTLEDAFLAGRSKATDTAMPMISTENGLNIQDSLYYLLKPFTDFESKYSDSLSQSLKAFNINNQCQPGHYLEQLFSQLDQFSQISDMAIQSDIKLLKEKIIAYNRDLESIYQKDPKIDWSLYNKDFNILIEGSHQQKINFTFSLQKIVESSPEIVMSMLETQIKNLENDPNVDSVVLEEKKVQLKLYSKIKNLKEVALSKMPMLSAVDRYFSQIASKVKDGEQKALEISKLEKKIYDEFYRKSRKINENDPCRLIKM